MKSRNKKEDFDIKFYEGIVKSRPDYVDALIPLAEAYTRYGFYQDGLEIDKRLAKLCKKDAVVRYNLGCSYALVGDSKKALVALKKSIALGYDDFNHMKRDSDLKSLRDKPAFKKLFI